MHGFKLGQTLNTLEEQNAKSYIGEVVSNQRDEIKQKNNTPRKLSSQKNNPFGRRSQCPHKPRVRLWISKDDTVIIALTK